MKVHVTTDKELRERIRSELMANDYYCPCVVNSRGKEEYKCMCEDFRKRAKPGETCHCGLYIKDNDTLL